jgi:hypothetical protein
MSTGARQAWCLCRMGIDGIMRGGSSGLGVLATQRWPVPNCGDRVGGRGRNRTRSPPESLPKPKPNAETCAAMPTTSYSVSDSYWRALLFGYVYDVAPAVVKPQWRVFLGFLGPSGFAYARTEPSGVPERGSVSGGFCVPAGRRRIRQLDITNCDIKLTNQPGHHCPWGLTVRQADRKSLRRGS